MNLSIVVSGMRMEKLRLCLLAVVLWLHATLAAMPCAEIHRELGVPCRCDVRPVSPELVPQGIGVLMDCDHVVFPTDLPVLPAHAPIVGFSQRYAGHQSLPSPVFSRQELPLQKLDLSHNKVRRLPERLLTAVAEHLEELYLNNNLLGDNLNPIFASQEFHNLASLKVLDLSGNLVRGIEEGIFRGCNALQELRLDDNLLDSVPSSSLHGPHTLRTLSLAGNNIHTIKQGSFTSQSGLERVRLNGNDMDSLEGLAFNGLTKLRELSLANNKFARFNSDVFQGIENLEKLDLSQNFLTDVPEEAVKVLPHLKHLNLSSNQIRTVGQSLQMFQYLEILDLSRNNIASIQPTTFHTLRRLRRLDLSVNSLRTIEDDAFEGLDNLEILSLEDNNILLIPSSALGRLGKLSVLNLSYNRVSAISPDILRSFANRLISLNLARNVIREIQDATFQHLSNLKLLDLSGNLLTKLDGDMFMGVEESLESLSVADNKISTLSGTPLQLSMLKVLDLSGNLLDDVPKTAIVALPNLRYFNLSDNSGIELLSSTMFQGAMSLLTLDISRCGIRNVHPDLFSRLDNLKVLKMSGNRLHNISDTAFRSLKNLTYLDLTENSISNIRVGAFGNLANLKVLLLDKNRLTALKGEYFKFLRNDFKNFTSIEVLSISDNDLNYLFPSSFKIHPKLKYLSAHHNKLNYFPAELISSLQYLEKIDVGYNKLRAVEDMDFSRLPRLRELILRGNEIEALSENAFHNSTQLQVIDLGQNRIPRIAERTFEGLLRLQHLNLEGNALSDLPDSLFDRSRLQILENINLANNQFSSAPLQTLRRQYFFLISANLSRNLIQEIPPEDVTMVNVKELDLSYNPLTDESVGHILEEPKTVRELSLSGVNIKNLSDLEMPFLKKLDLSHNNISALSSTVFQRATMLDTINLSNNKISNLLSVSAWKSLPVLKHLDLSDNPIEEILTHQFDDLTALKKLNIHNLEFVMKIEKNAFKPLVHLRELTAYGYPRLGYLDVKGILQFLSTLEALDVELKDGTVGSDELTYVMHPQLRYLGLRGRQVTAISTGVFAGLKAPHISLKIANTSVTSLPQGLFFPLPRSSDVNLDIANSQVSSLTPQFLAMFEDHRKNLELTGLETNPIICDCTARALKKWLKSHQKIKAVCHDAVFSGQNLNQIADEDLTCEVRSTTEATTTTTLATKTFSKIYRRPTTEADIIWSVTPKKKTTPKPPKLITSATAATVNNDDMLIISIVGGVVAFIVILVIVICIIRLRMVNTPYRGGPLATPVPYPASNAYVYPMKPGAAPPSIYMAPTYATLPHKAMSAGLEAASTKSAGHPTLRPGSQMHSYYHNSVPPPSQSAYYVPYTPDENIEYR